MKHSELLKWAEVKFNILTSELSEECMVCDFVNRGDKHHANSIWNKKFNPEFQKEKRKFRKRYKKTRLNKFTINKRVSQISTLNITYRTILVDNESSDIEKEEAKQKLKELSRLRNLYYANIKDYINSLSVKTKLGDDFLEIILFAFAPASFLTGYFGMNFTSMGNPGKNTNTKGILVGKHGHYAALFMVLFFCVASYFLVTNNFYNKDIETIETIKSFNELLNMPQDDDYI